MTTPPLNNLKSNHTGLAGRLPLVQILSVLLGMVFWEVAARWLSFPFLPPLSGVIGRSFRLLAESSVQGHLLTSAISLVTGYTIAAAVGILVGILMGRFRRIGYALDIYLDAFLAAPSLVFVPILFSLFGVSRLTQTAVVVLYSLFVIIANTMAGIREIDTELVEMARSFGAGEVQILRRVRIPAALPLIHSGLQIGASRAVKGMINGELFIALVGLGALIRTYGGRFDAEGVFAVLIFVALIALSANLIMARLERHIAIWRHKE